MTKGDDPVSPMISGRTYTDRTQDSLTKREHFAAMAMQALAQNNDYVLAVHQSRPETGKRSLAEAVAIGAVQYADALIKELNKNV